MLKIFILIIGALQCHSQKTIENGSNVRIQEHMTGSDSMLILSEMEYPNQINYAYRPSYNSYSMPPNMFNRQYNGLDKEESAGRLAYDTNYRKIVNHNRLADQGQYSFRMRMNQFGQMSTNEFLRKMTGFRPELRRRRYRH